MNRIRALREQQNLRQIDVAKATGIDQKTLSNYETEKTNPDSFAIMALADFFNVTTDYLLGYSSKNLNNRKKLISTIDQIQKSLSDIRKYLNSDNNSI